MNDIVPPSGPVIFDYDLEARHVPKEAALFLIQEWGVTYETQRFLARHAQPIEDA